MPTCTTDSKGAVFLSQGQEINRCLDASLLGYNLHLPFAITYLTNVPEVMVRLYAASSLHFASIIKTIQRG